MRRAIFPILFFIVLINFACEKEDPEIATLDELSSFTISKSFVCQPLAYDNNIVAVVSTDNQLSLQSYSASGDSLWEQSLNPYLPTGISFNDIEKLDFKKDQQGNLIFSMAANVLDEQNSKTNHYFKTIKFNQGGGYQWQLEDSIHQRDTIIIQQDTIDLVGMEYFTPVGSVFLSNGNLVAVSSLEADALDSTYLQFSEYNASGQFIADNYYKIEGKRDFIDIYCSSDDHLFMVNSTDGAGTSFLMTDMQATVIFDLPVDGLLIDTYFFHENSNGNYVISASFVDNTAVRRGAILAINNAGVLLWSRVFEKNPSLIMLSVNETSDGYIFSGFNSNSLLIESFDWRTTFFEEEHHAVILKTDLSGQGQWQQILNTIFYSAGAITIGNSPLSLFAGRYERSLNSIFILKFNDTGEFYNQ